MADREERRRDDDKGLAVAESKPEVKRPPMYKVILLNDDYTPMEFVVHILEQFFSMDRPARDVERTHPGQGCVRNLHPRGGRNQGAAGQ